MGKIIFIFSFVFAFTFQFVSGFSSVVISDYVHKEIDSSVRATTFSIKSFIDHIFYVLMAPMVGWIVDVYTLPQALMVMGVIVGVVGCIIIGAMMFPAKEFSNRKQSE
jgi:MFS family permease